MLTRFEQKKITDTNKREIEESFILGKLAEDGPGIPGIGVDPGKAVSYTRFTGPDNVVFYIQACSDEPYLFKSLLDKKAEDVYITFDNRNKLYLERESYFNAEDKVNFIREHFKDKLILFKPRLNYEESKKRYHYNFDIVLVEEEGESCLHYVAIPHIKKGMSHKRFEKLLIDQKPIELEQYNHSLEIPEFIVCDNFIYHIPDSDVLEKYSARTTTYICRKAQDVKRIPLPKEWHFSMTKAMYKELCFISTKTRLELTSQFDELGEYIIDSYKQIEKEKNGYYSRGSFTNEDASVSGIPNMDQQKEENRGIIAEHEFLERLDALAEEKDLIYDKNDIKNLHISLKTSKFTILGGMSGTGKSELARLYAEALGLKEKSNLLFLPISPSYTEPADILGFLNQQTGIYMESDTGLVSFLLKAKKEPDKMFMIILDEMNLGQVEHYFSDFISVLEAPAKQRYLKLFSDKAICHQEEYRNGLEIGDNVLFIGTANFDETTKDFSNRMLDRSNVIILEKKGFLEAKIYEEEQSSEPTEVKHQIDMNTGITTTNYKDWIQETKGLKSLQDVELKILDEIHEQINSYDSQTGVSFRIAKDIALYLANIPKDEDENELLSRDVAFDYQIKQRILPKIRGYRDQIENIVFKMDSDGKIKEGTIGMILSKYEELNFEKSLKYLEQKAKELIRNGYTL
ncbi:McrB family protein [Bacillus paramycoides]|uniref:McrB family protein n=1 Tax=Bacillus paramycoides TaxID=2026194 RepID=UPI004058D419